jgi:hypothetical protein
MNEKQISQLTTDELYRRIDFYYHSDNAKDQRIHELICRELDRREVFNVVQ